MPDRLRDLLRGQNPVPPQAAGALLSDCAQARLLARLQSGRRVPRRPRRAMATVAATVTLVAFLLTVLMLLGGVAGR